MFCRISTDNKGLLKKLDHSRYYGFDNWQIALKERLDQELALPQVNRDEKFISLLEHNLALRKNDVVETIIEDVKTYIDDDGIEQEDFDFIAYLFANKSELIPYNDERNKYHLLKIMEIFR